jgi:hypothetical protein
MFHYRLNTGATILLPVKRTTCIQCLTSPGGGKFHHVLHFRKKYQKIDPSAGIGVDDSAIPTRKIHVSKQLHTRLIRNEPSGTPCLILLGSAARRILFPVRLTAIRPPEEIMLDRLFRHCVIFLVVTRRMSGHFMLLFLWSFPLPAVPHAIPFPSRRQTAKKSRQRRFP